METKPPAEQSIDPLLPPAMASKAEEIGVAKAKMPFLKLLALSVLAGAFIAMGALFATTVGAGDISVRDALGEPAFSSGMPYGVTRLLAGIVFSVGLILVIVGGAELFTGNNLIIMAFSSRRVTLRALLRNWAVVYFGNLVGSVATAWLVFLSKQYTFGKGVVGLAALNIGELKTSFDFIQAIALGILCNALVCLAVWLCFSARSTTDKVLSIIPTIACFVAAGFEHCIANMYFIPLALLIKSSGNTAFFESIGKTPDAFSHLNWENFFVANLLPVTIGNIIGGAVMVGLVYWFVYRSDANK